MTLNNVNCIYLMNHNLKLFHMPRSAFKRRKDIHASLASYSHISLFSYPGFTAIGVCTRMFEKKKGKWVSKAGVGAERAYRENWGERVSKAL